MPISSDRQAARASPDLEPGEKEVERRRLAPGNYRMRLKGTQPAWSDDDKQVEVKATISTESDHRSGYDSTASVVVGSRGVARCAGGRADRPGGDVGSRSADDDDAASAARCGRPGEGHGVAEDRPLSPIRSWETYQTSDRSPSSGHLLKRRSIQGRVFDGQTIKSRGANGAH